MDEELGQMLMLQRALRRLARWADDRHGEVEPDQRVSIEICDYRGNGIGACSLPASVLDDLTLAVQQMARRTCTENHERGISFERWADADLERLDAYAAQGKDPNEIRATARARYEEAAQRTEQPEDSPTGLVPSDMDGEVKP